MRCAACDRINAADARFCVGCGIPLAYAYAPPAAASPHQPSVSTADYAGAVTPAGGAYPAYGYGYPAPAQPAYGYLAPAYAPAVQVVNNINITSVAAPSPALVLGQDAGPSLLVRALWFLFIGLWLGAACTVLAWLLLLTIIGLPLGLYIINRLPRIMTLKPVPLRLHVTVQNGVTIVRQGAVAQRPFAVRALYFLLVGSWASLVWLLIAWALVGATLGLGLPLAFWMFDRVPAVTTLAR